MPVGEASTPARTGGSSGSITMCGLSAHASCGPLRTGSHFPFPFLAAALLELEPLIFSPEFCTEGGLSYDDIDLWARCGHTAHTLRARRDPPAQHFTPTRSLRSLTVIKGLVYPPKVRAYLDFFEAKGDVPLYDVMAL